MKRWIGMLALASALAIAGCSSDSGDDGGSPGVDTVTGVGADTGAGGGADVTTQAAPTGTFVTFNAGLAYSFVPYATERQPFVIQSVGGLDADIVCLQEVWNPDDVAALTTAVAATYPNVYWVDQTGDTGTGGPACTPDEADPLMACYTEHCTEAPSLIDCVMENCATEFGALSSTCSGCLASHINEPVDDMFTACTEGSGGSYAYDGANGVVLLSRWPLTDTAHLDFESTEFNRRGALFARATKPDGTTLAVTCTHLTADLSGSIPYQGTYGSYAEEQADQIGRLITFAEDKADDAEPILIMGDLNTGPAVGTDVVAELADNWALFGAAGYTDAFSDSADAVCTYCASNPLNDGGDSVLLDHVLAKGWPEGLTWAGTRVLDGTETLSTSDGDLDLPASDHYGLSVSAE